MAEGGLEIPGELSLEGLLDFVKESRGFDFSGYKRGSLERRIRKRMDAVGAETYDSYRDHLETNRREFAELFNTVLINVTAFFRDPEAWDFLARDVVPKLLEEIPPDQPVRVWSAGCASGEEAYTTAIVLAEAMGEDAFRARVKIYGTDIDEHALAEARQGTYGQDALDAIPDDLVERYFEEVPTGHAFRPDLRRSVIFGRNDLVQDAPISRVDLLVCRNTLMYFTAETQTRVLGRLNFALNQRGYLFLGRSEMLVTRADLFAPYDLKHRVFKRAEVVGTGERLAFVGVRGERAKLELGGPATELRSAALAASPVAQVTLDRQGVVADVNARAIELFGLSLQDLGRPFQDLELSYRPVDVRSGLQDAYAGGATVELGRVPWERRPGEVTVVLEVTVVPLGDPANPAGASVLFEDVTEQDVLAREHARAKEDVERAYAALQSTNEELETTNEELQSTNEELETTNEELQSTNEELETMNEELQSTNDELETVNEEQRRHTVELDRVQLFLEGLLANLGLGVVVLDEGRAVQVWSPGAEDLWGLRQEEVAGVDFLELDTGLPVAEIADGVRAALADRDAATDEVVEAVNRRGRSFRCRVRILPLVAGYDHYGAIVIMSDLDEPAPEPRAVATDAP